MTRLLQRHLTFSNLIALAALFIALGGTAVAVTQLPRNSVGPVQLRPGAVQKFNLSREAVGRNKLGRGAVNNIKISRWAVNARTLANGSVHRFKLTPDAVDSSRLADDAVGSSQLQSGAVGPAQIQSGSVGSDALASGAVGANDLANGSVNRAKVNQNSLPMLSTLRTGQTLRGMFALGGEGTRYVDAQTFEFPMLFTPVAPPENVIDIAGGSPDFTEQCPGIAGGNQQTPQATEGQLCLYIIHREGDSPTLSATVGTPTRLGFGLTAEFASSGENLIVGQWAATAG